MKSCRIEIRLNEEDRRLIELGAKLKNMSMSDYLRHLVMADARKIIDEYERNGLIKSE